MYTTSSIFCSLFYLHIRVHKYFYFETTCIYIFYKPIYVNFDLDRQFKRLSSKNKKQTNKQSDNKKEHTQLTKYKQSATYKICLN